MWGKRKKGRIGGRIIKKHCSQKFAFTPLLLPIIIIIGRRGCTLV